jgi:hypothetical protein
VPKESNQRGHNARPASLMAPKPAPLSP